MRSEEEQKALLERELLQREIQHVENEIIALEKRKIELDIVLASIDEILKQKGDETLVPIGSGVFVKGKLVNKNKVFVNVGADVVIEKNVEEAKKIINAQRDEISKLQELLENNLREFIKNVQQNTGRS